MAAPPVNDVLIPEKRRQRILEARSLDRLLDESDGEVILRAEAAYDEDKRLITPAQLDFLLTLRSERRKALTKPQFLFSSEDVILIPGFLGSTLVDVSGANGLIWIDPLLVFNGGQLSALRLGTFDENTPETESTDGVTVNAADAVPGQYDLMSIYLRLFRYAPTIFAFDWRKDLEDSAQLLADHLRARVGQSRPLHIVAHSQGTLVARRALQLLGAETARQLVNNLILLGPASFGSFSAAFALSGSPNSWDILERFKVRVPDDFPEVLKTFTGLYQLLPWNRESFDNQFNPLIFKTPGNWTNGIDKDRLAYGFGWSERIDTTFFSDRTTIILGDQKMSGAIEFDANGIAVEIGPLVQGDGTITDANARLKGVRTFRMPGGVHATLPMYRTVMSAVRSIMKGELPSLDVVPLAAAADGVVTLHSMESVAPPAVASAKATPAPASVRSKRRAAPADEALTFGRPEPEPPPCRKLRVFSFDPLLATNLDALGIAEITVDLPWEKLGPGPVGEYIEVVDYDPASRRFYHPVDLTHERIVAQDGLKPSESNPQFHQQMVYAASMSTITAFEKALGRVALWAPRLKRGQAGNVQAEEYVARLRIYPHALRAENAYYDPETHALLFGYFASRERPGGDTLPGGTVFACLSFDIVAHETTHALLHGLHRYYLYSSNLDMLAFHEAFADAVALFQNFAQPAVVEHQIARTRGNLRSDNLLGQLARQFGSAMGEHRGALREYISRPPDPSLLGKTKEPHDRGAILMAAIFRAFLNIYDNRTKDLYRIATNGTGRLPDGEIHPDLVRRLSIEASRSAKHMLMMCVRALDYVPPVDLTFGEFLRALITADYDLVRDDDRGYRVSVLDAFRSWGIYPADVPTLDQEAVLWEPPANWSVDPLRKVIPTLDLSNWSAKTDRRTVYRTMNENCRKFREFLFTNARDTGDTKSFGVLIFGNSHLSIPRNDRNTPKFEVHSVRPCRRIGPDGQQREDLVVEIVQRRAGYLDEKKQADIDSGRAEWEKPDFWFRGGSTLIIDPRSHEVRYSIRKSVLNDARLADQRTFERGGGHFSLAATYFGSNERNPFALLHAENSEQLYGW